MGRDLGGGGGGSLSQSTAAIDQRATGTNGHEDGHRLLKQQPRTGAGMWKNARRKNWSFKTGSVSVTVRDLCSWLVQ